MRHGLPTILFVIALGIVKPTLGVNFTECFADIRRGAFGPDGGTDGSGHPVSNISDAVGITFALCERACGTGPTPLSWPISLQKFGAWLLPWLALISQLPFGASDKFQNLTSILLAVGSPTLAAYSLALTVLGSRWGAKRFSDISFPNVDCAFHIMNSLQQAPLKIDKEDGLLHSLVVLPENDKWWGELVVGLDYTHTWSISAATSILWVLVAYLFTVVAAVIKPNPGDGSFSGGQSVASAWLWLLPVVLGWLQISPKCDRPRLDSALACANALAYIATDNGDAS